MVEKTLFSIVMAIVAISVLSILVTFLRIALYLAVGWSV